MNLFAGGRFASKLLATCHPSLATCDLPPATLLADVAQSLYATALAGKILAMIRPLFPTWPSTVLSMVLS
jgi:hypothetical protein